MQFGRLLSAVLLSLMPVTAFAALSKEHKEWANGPEKWIMTREEQRAWKAVSTDEQATDFIDLFWARRDPTPGTPQNEFRADFDARVAHADRRYRNRQDKTRGSLTDRGRFFIVLGPASNMDDFQRSDGYNVAMNTGGQSNDVLGGRELGQRNIWQWNHEDAQKFGMPQIEVVFIEDPITGNFKRDTQRNEVMGALPKAIELAIRNPELTSVPEWAAKGGLKPAEVVVKKVVAPTSPVGDLPKGDLGASRFTLVKDVFAINSQAKDDLFATMQPATSFTKQEEVGWAARYCTDAALESITVGLKITGEIKGQRVNMSADPESMAPDRIRAMANCYLVRGSVPTSDMDAGLYEIEVTLTDPNTQQSHPLKSVFKVE